ELGAKLLGETGLLDWQSMRDTGQIRQAIAQVVPGYEQIADIGTTRQEFQLEGRTFHAPQFGTPDGKARLHAHALPELPTLESDQLRLMTVRSEGQFNTVVYEDDDLYRGQDRRDVVLIHPDDMERLGLTADQRVTVRSATGSLAWILARPFDKIRPGNVLMYYPEANVLVPRTVDPASRTPAFKGIVVRIVAG
ncbi:MAG: histidine kinase, partial [Planctomycetota bacterium]|nr:histidine kinase [Planctomycetota bacterium]